MSILLAIHRLSFNIYFFRSFKPEFDWKLINQRRAFILFWTIGKIVFSFLIQNIQTVLKDCLYVLSYTFKENRYETLLPYIKKKNKPILYNLVFLAQSMSVMELNLQLPN